MSPYTVYHVLCMFVYIGFNVKINEFLQFNLSSGWSLLSFGGSATSLGDKFITKYISDSKFTYP